MIQQVFSTISKTITIKFFFLISSPLLLLFADDQQKSRNFNVAQSKQKFANFLLDTNPAIIGTNENCVAMIGIFQM